jgi:hypothetical protein
MDMAVGTGMVQYIGAWANFVRVLLYGHSKRKENKEEPEGGRNQS